MRSLVYGVATLGAALAAMPASAVLLDFSGAICGESGREACGNGTFIGQRYGDRIQVDVSHRTIDVRTGEAVESLRYWGRQFGDLSGVIFGGYDSFNYRSEITFTAAPGYGVSLVSFDAACYRSRSSCQTINYNIDSLTGFDIAAGSAALPKLGHTQVTINSLFYTGITLGWGVTGFDVGLDNVLFLVKRVPDGALQGSPLAVPEPTTWAMMIAGFGLVGGAVRRRRTAAAAV